MAANQLRLVFNLEGLKSDLVQNKGGKYKVLGFQGEDGTFFIPLAGDFEVLRSVEGNTEGSRQTMKYFQRAGFPLISVLIRPEEWKVAIVDGRVFFKHKLSGEINEIELSGAVLEAFVCLLEEVGQCAAAVYFIREIALEELPSWEFLKTCLALHQSHNIKSTGRRAVM